jgi:hypothetical protein
MCKTNPISGGPIYPSIPIPLFQHSSPKRVVRNEANLPGALQEGARAAKVAHAGAAGPRRVKQSQFRRSGRIGKYLVEKELWRIEHARDLRKTKPISSRRTRTAGRWQGSGRNLSCKTKPICLGSAARGTAGTGCTNKANWPRTDWKRRWAGAPNAAAGGDKRAKRSQFPPGPTRGIWNPPPYAGHTRRTREPHLFLIATLSSCNLLVLVWGRV